MPQTLELGVTGSHQNAPTATSARGPILAPSANHTSNVAGGVFCHADVRVCGIETADRLHADVRVGRIEMAGRKLAFEPSDPPVDDPPEHAQLAG
jgi:hypothetical protein